MTPLAWSRSASSLRAVILADAIRPDLRVVFCGTALGTVAARKRAYYAGPGNAFYETLCRIGLTPRRLEPAQYEELLDYGIGLTDVAKTVSGPDASIPVHAFDRERLATSIRALRPGCGAPPRSGACRRWRGRTRR